MRNSSWNAGPHPEQGFRARRGILRLVRTFRRKRFEATAASAIDIGVLSDASVRPILDHKLDRHAAHERAGYRAPILYHNIRGARFYNLGAASASLGLLRRSATGTRRCSVRAPAHSDGKLMLIKAAIPCSAIQVLLASKSRDMDADIH